jgi:hypothetical protein
MFSALNTKLLIVIVALLACIAAGVAYEVNKDRTIEQQRRQALRAPTAQDKKDRDKGMDWGNSPAAQNKK